MLSKDNVFAVICEHIQSGEKHLTVGLQSIQKKKCNTQLVVLY
jgi:hypothetical protein